MSKALPRNHPLPVETTNGYRRLYSLEEQSAVPDCRNDHPSNLQLQMSVVNLNTCSFQELLQLPGIGIKTGEQIMDIRESKGFVTESDLATISHLRVTRGLLSRLDFSPNGGGQNIGPPPQAQGRHGEMLDRGHIAPQGTPSQVQGQSAFRQEAWHQGQSPGPLEGPSQMDSAFLEYSPYPGMLMLDLNPQGIGMGATGNSYRKKSGVTMILVTQTKVVPLTTCTGVVLGTSRIGQVKTVHGTNLPLNYWGTPSHPMGHACNYAGQGSAPCTQPAYTGGGQYEMACSKYGTRQTPSHDYGDRQPKNQYNQGYTAVPPQGVTAGVSYRQQAYPVPYNEDRPMENTRGPDNRGWARGTSSGVSKPNRREVRQVTDGQYGDNHEAFCEYQGPHVRDTMALERAPVSTWKVELENSDKKFENKLGQVHEKLDDMMDQFKQLLTSPIAGSCLPGRQTGTESCHHCGERGHSNLLGTHCTIF
ncbi:unnamed protein product [Mytilus edulis]|uniref:Uncharacterized protein n=1 Tax=Mytilus edulis TaxID=6550 RepID=A0A8S3R000_MYTED|nr:unnamed protein product [Mytilus edulis]